MLNNNLKFPTFDASDLDIDLEFNYHKYAKLSPVKCGDFVTALTTNGNKGKWHPYFYENLYNHASVSFAYTKKPLVVYFHSQQWGAAGIEHLKQLNALQQEIQYHGANLLVVTADSIDEIRQIQWNNSLSLEFYSDTQKEIASLLGIYAENSPAWSRYAGVEENVPLPAVFVFDNVRQVVYGHANEDILSSLPLANITAAVYQSHKFDERKSA